ncbi:MAG: hypothetical protein R3B70_35565 [Polyangiaceae bacterium]
MRLSLAALAVALGFTLSLACVGPPSDQPEPPSLDDDLDDDLPTTATQQPFNSCLSPVAYSASMAIGLIPACGSSYASGPIDDCYNTAAPPLPSLLRNYVTPVNAANSGTIAFPDGAWQADKSFLLPVFRTSNDGRLTLLDGPLGHIVPRLGLFLPENAGYDLMPHPTASRRAVSANEYQLHAFHLFNPLDTRLAVAPLTTAVGQKVWQMPPLNHVNICDDSGSGFTPGAPPQITNRRNPRVCSAPFRTGTPALSGDCYDITLQGDVALCADPQKSVFDNCPDTIWEIRSADLTVFVPNARRTTAGEWSLPGVGNPSDFPVWVYPRQPPGSTLPAYDGDGTLDQTYNLNAIDPDRTYTEAQRCYDGGVPPVHASNAPRWCELLWNQKHTPAPGFQLDADGDATDNPIAWNGSGSGGLALFEPATTGDGRLLIVNAMQAGLMYSYISPVAGNACDASKWTTFRPLSRMMRDTAVQDKYELTRSQMLRDSGGNLLLDPTSRANARLFRDTMGQPIPAGSPLPGAYLWIDRQGRNAIFSHAVLQRTGYKAKKAKVYGATYSANVGTDLTLTPDRANGKGQSILGSWTQGKVIHLDNAMNLADWGGRTDWQGDRFIYDMSLYNECDPQGAPVLTTVKPKSNTEVFSLENHLNHFDAMNPELPFDVVWRAQGDGQVNAEIAFDDYVRNNALIVAHMNPAIDIRCGNTGGADMPCSAFSGQLRRSDGRILDGFLPDGDPWAGTTSTTVNSNDRFQVDPTLQNAATSSAAYDPGAVTPPSSLRLRGGARVEPINAGGVLGKGIYLDGQNDLIDAAYPYQSGRTEWWLGVWLDSRDLATLRTLFFFPDESSIALKGDRIVAHDGPRSAQGAAGVEQTLMLPLGLLQEGKFFHFAAKLTTESGSRVLRFSIDGVPLPQVLTYSALPGIPLGFQLMKSGQPNGFTWFALAGCTTDWNPPFKGWVDELKVLSLTPTELANANGFFDELACNNALGTQVDLSVQPGELKSPYLLALRSKLATYGYTHPGSGVLGKPIRAAFCEQLALTPDPTRADLPRQHNKSLLCAHRVHKTQTSNRCLRSSALGLTPLQPQSPLPSFSTTSFCLGCHHTGAQASGLTLTALTPGSLPAEQDPRRRPMTWPAVVTGNQYTDPFTSTTHLPGWLLCDPLTPPAPPSTAPSCPPPTGTSPDPPLRSMEKPPMSTQISPPPD